MERKAWTYKGVAVFPAGVNGSGVRWTANMGIGVCLRAASKRDMRRLITENKEPYTRKGT
jgi:hypothetical protein